MSLSRGYEIREVHAPDAEPLGVVEADTDIDALADYAVLSGFADPRETDEDFFYRRTDGSYGMVFTNTELCAVPQKVAS